MFFNYLYVLTFLYLVRLTAEKCDPKQFPPGVKFTAPCSFQPGHACSVACLIRGKVIWSVRTSCREDGKWSYIPPYCKRTTKILAIEAIDCKKVLKKEPASAFCIKRTLYHRHRKLCPEMPGLKMSGCLRLPGTECTFPCANRYETLVCHPDGKWSDVPDCSVRCPEPDIGTLVDCSRREGQTCKIRCPDGKYLTESATCLSSGTWSVADLINEKHSKVENVSISTATAQCTCPFPRVTDELEVFDCRDKKIGEACLLQCKTRSSPEFIVCQENGTWSQLPACPTRTCQAPILPETSTSVGNCSLMNIGDACRIKCLKVDESHEITCQADGRWTNFPPCSCPVPVLTESVMLKENCRFEKPGEACKISCKSVPSEDLYVLCQNNSEWSKEPPCKELQTVREKTSRETDECPTPVLPSYLSFAEDCSGKTDGGACNITCARGYLVGDSIIKCVRGRRWSSFPTCTCPDPVIGPDLEIMGDCSLKKPGEDCTLRCKGDENDKRAMTCQSDATWTPRPVCDGAKCKQLRLPSYLSFKWNCTDNEADSFCEVFCVHGGEAMGSTSVVCTNFLKWSPLPTCLCPDLRTNENFLPEDKCVRAQPGDTCRVKCKPRLKLVGDPAIRCLTGGKWSLLPACTLYSCTKPELPKTLTFSEPCTNKVPEDVCVVRCKGTGKLIGENYLACLNETNWTKAPYCVCPLPRLKTGLKTLNSCDVAVPGKTCELACEHDAKLIGGNSISCGSNFVWNTTKSRPRCTCRYPELNSDLKPIGNCNHKSIGRKCRLKCRNIHSIISTPFITCEEAFKWSEQPTCSKQYCNISHVSELEGVDDDCSKKSPGESCNVRCRKGGALIGDSTILCRRNLTFSGIPYCVCRTSQLRDDLHLIDECLNVKPGMQCAVKCENDKAVTGNGLVTCQEDFTWSSQPDCRICPEPSLPKDITRPTENCTNKTEGQTCSLECARGGSVIGSSFITCLRANEWSEPPDCTCPPVEVRGNIGIKGDCSRKKVGEVCEVECADGTRLGNGDGFATCTSSATWSDLPRCVPVVCPELRLVSSVMKPESDCESKAPGDRCVLVCTEGGRFAGIDFVECLDGGVWGTLPDCACQTPAVDEAVYSIDGDCANISQEGRCKVSCKNNKTLQGDSFITCLSNTLWSHPAPCV